MMVTLSEEYDDSLVDKKTKNRFRQFLPILLYIFSEG